jgi:hypothetical protein
MRISQGNDFLSTIVGQVAKGRMAPAAFQRPYVWDDADVEAMFASILKGWPLGAFLVWEPSSDVDMTNVSRGRLGPIPASTQREDRVGLILDGQNRLASFAWAISQYVSPVAPDLDYSDAERATWLSNRTLVADLETRSIVFVHRNEDTSGTRMPVGALCDSYNLNAAIRRADKEFGLSDEALQWFGDEVPTRMREARIQTTTLQNATVAEAREAFLHICRVGKPIDPAHLEAAIGWTEEETPSFGPRG